MSGAVQVEQDFRREQLAKRILVFADLLDDNPLPGEDGDIAYDLLREAAARISSDRLTIKRLLSELAAAQRASVDRKAVLEEAAKVATYGRAELQPFVAQAALAWVGRKDRETSLDDITYFEENWWALQGMQNFVRATAVRALAQQETNDDE